MSHKHRRPAAIARLGRRPLHFGVAAGVAGTVAMTGTLVASAAPTLQHPSLNASPVAVTVTVAQERASQRGAAERALAVRAQRLVAAATAKAEALAKAKAARKAAAKKAAAQRLAAAARKKKAASRSVRGASDASMSASAAHVLAIAAAQSGDRYVHGGRGPDSFDCSGFTMYVFGKVGISLPHSSSAQRAMVRSIPASALRPGDLVFVYNGAGGSVGHVAIYAGGGYWYEASNPSIGVGKHRAWSSSVSYGRVL